MADNKPVYVELDGKRRALKFTFNAMADFEDYFGLGIGQVFSQQNMGFRVIRALYWAGLRHKDKGLTITKTGIMLQKAMKEGESLDSLMEPLNKAIDSSGIFDNMGDEEDEDDRDDVSSDEEGEEEKNE